MNLDTFFYLSQSKWIQDNSPLKLVVKSRQTGFSWCTSYRTVLITSAADARLDSYISSRDLHQARLQLEDCKRWAQFLNLGATDLGQLVFDDQTGSSAYVLEFANG